MGLKNISKTVKRLKLPGKVVNGMGSCLYCPKSSMELAKIIWEIRCENGIKFLKTPRKNKEYYEFMEFLSSEENELRGRFRFRCLHTLKLFGENRPSYHNRNDQHQSKLLNVDGIMMDGTRLC